MLWILSKARWKRCNCGGKNCKRWWFKTGETWPLNVRHIDVCEILGRF